MIPALSSRRWAPRTRWCCSGPTWRRCVTCGARSGDQSCDDDTELSSYLLQVWRQVEELCVVFLQKRSAPDDISKVRGSPEVQILFSSQSCVYKGIIIFSPGSSSSRQSGSGSGFSFQNALIGQQDMSKFYRTSTTQKIFGMVSKLCEIGKFSDAAKNFPSVCCFFSETWYDVRRACKFYESLLDLTLLTESNEIKPWRRSLAV